MTLRRTLLLGLVPLLLLLCGLRSLPPERVGGTRGQEQALAHGHFRTVVLVLDSVGTPMAFDPELMPFVSGLRATSLFGEAEACPAKATFPCVKSIFEGRSATTGTALQDFSATISHRAAWPRSLAKLGLRLVVTSDHTLNRLYPEAFVDSLNYETLHAPLLARDGFAYARARQWLEDASVDVLLLHIVGTDKVSHEYPVGGEVYRAKYHEVDDFVREVAGRLAPQDYLFVIGDHGHNAVGGHTSDAVYIAHGPLFPQSRNENLRSADMLFLLSLPYGLTMPDEYEGAIRSDLTSLSEDGRRALLSAQARQWQIDATGLTSAELEARLNARVAAERKAGDAAHVLTSIKAVGPWLVAAAFFLMANLEGIRRGRVQVLWLVRSAAALLAIGIVAGLSGANYAGVVAALGAISLCLVCIGVRRTLLGAALFAVVVAIVFWIEPRGLRWYYSHKNQPLVFAVFYSLSLALGFAFARGEPSLGRRIASALWTVGLAVWLFAPFGPYSSALTGQSSEVVLAIVVPLAVFAARGWRAFRVAPAFLLIALLPFITFHTESYNIAYPLLDLVATAPRPLAFSVCALLLLVYSCALHLGEEANIRWRRVVFFFAGVSLWVALATLFFQIDIAKTSGSLLAAMTLAGFFELFRRNKFPARWYALVSAILLFVCFHFLLNGFALSHVDFRFAANKIIVFPEESLRAPQLIAWTVVKYLFALLPILLVIVLRIPVTTANALLQFGWWRGLMIVLGALGLAVFDPRGLDELCGEEIYFWTFLSVALLLVTLALALRQKRASFSFAPAMQPAAPEPARTTSLEQ